MTTKEHLKLLAKSIFYLTVTALMWLFWGLSKVCKYLSIGFNFVTQKLALYVKETLSDEESLAEEV
jgi:ammonia channel protein AmtB